MGKVRSKVFILLGGFSDGRLEETQGRPREVSGWASEDSEYGVRGNASTLHQS